MLDHKPRDHLNATSYPCHPSISYALDEPDDDVLQCSSPEYATTPQCSGVLERTELNKGRILYRLRPDPDGTFAISIIGGIDHGFAPYISKGNKYGLRSGDTIVAINSVPVFEHTHSQIRESIRSSAAACGELAILIDREIMTVDESLALIANERTSLIEQFEVEPLKNQNLSQLTALKRENRAKNRYTDVLPYDDTR